MNRRLTPRRRKADRPPLKLTLALKAFRYLAAPAVQTMMMLAGALVLRPRWMLPLAILFFSSRAVVVVVNALSMKTMYRPVIFVRPRIVENACTTMFVRAFRRPLSRNLIVSTCPPLPTPIAMLVGMGSSLSNATTQ